MEQKVLSSCTQYALLPDAYCETLGLSGRNCRDQQETGHFRGKLHPQHYILSVSLGKHHPNPSAVLRQS